VLKFRPDIEAFILLFHYFNVCPRFTVSLGLLDYQQWWILNDETIELFLERWFSRKCSGHISLLKFKCVDCSDSMLFRTLYYQKLNFWQFEALLLVNRKRECCPPPLVLGGGTLACGWGWWEPIQTKGGTLWYSSYSIIPLRTEPMRHKVPRIPQCMSPCPNWDPHPSGGQISTKHQKTSIKPFFPDLMVGPPTSTVFPTNDRKFEISQFFRKKFEKI
jgi:hypothetical protein